MLCQIFFVSLYGEKIRGYLQFLFIVTGKNAQKK